MSSDGMADVLSFVGPRSDVALSESVALAGEESAPEQPVSVIVCPTGPADESLFAEVRSGSKDALALLFRRYRPIVLSIGRRILRDVSEAEDLCQEVFLLVFQKASLFDSSKGTASSWIIQIAHNRAMNRRQYLARRQHYNAHELDEQRIAGCPQLLIDEIAARSLLHRLRELLSAEQRETLELHFFEGYSLREIAEKTNQTLGNVRHHFYRGLDRLRSNVFPKKIRE